MTPAEREGRLEELYAEADRRGCCVIPAEPVPPPEPADGGEAGAGKLG